MVNESQALGADVLRQREIYMDHAATTAVHPKVLEAMLPYFSQVYGNPSGIYAAGREAREAMEGARRTVAEVLGCRPGEIIFTSGGTESDNAALKGSAFALRNEGNHIITSAIEHHAVLNTCHQLEAAGFEVTCLPVDRHGLVAGADLERAITARTTVISIMLASNEIGTVEPVAELVALARDKAGGRRIAFHTDAVQCGSAVELDVDKLGVDMLSLSAHKFNGPKGVGILYLKAGTPFVPQQAGGSQEDGCRAGTENIAGIVGAAAALELAADNRARYTEHCRKLRDRLIDGILAGVGGVHLNGHPTQRLPNNASFAFDFIEGESILLNLDLIGVAASSGSACASAEEGPSHVLLAIGLPPRLAQGSVRFTVGLDNSDEDVEYVLHHLPGIVDKLRMVSPLTTWQREDGGSGV